MAARPLCFECCLQGWGMGPSDWFAIGAGHVLAHGEDGRAGGFGIGIGSDDIADAIALTVVAPIWRQFDAPARATVVGVQDAQRGNQDGHGRVGSICTDTCLLWESAHEATSWSNGPRVQRLEKGRRRSRHRKGSCGRREWWRTTPLPKEQAGCGSATMWPGGGGGRHPGR